MAHGSAGSKRFLCRWGLTAANTVGQGAPTPIGDPPIVVLSDWPQYPDYKRAGTADAPGCAESVSVGPAPESSFSFRLSPSEIIWDTQFHLLC